MQRGSLKQVKDRRGVNVWRAQWREHGRGRTRILGRVLDLDRGRAQGMLDRILAPINGADNQAPSAPSTLKKYTEQEYLAARGRKWKGSTRLTTEQIIRTHILLAFGDRSLTSLSRRELQAHLDGMASRELSKSVVDHTRWQMSAILAMAMSDGAVTTNVASELVTPRCSGTVDQRVIDRHDLHRAQMGLDIRERLIFRLAGCEGMRPGEIVALQVGDIRDGIVHVERRIYRGVVDTPKSVKGRRPIPLTSITALVMESYRQLLKNVSGDAWLFPSENGTTPISYSNVYRRRIRPRLQDAGLGHVNAQILRRSFLSDLPESEKDPKIRAALAGHNVDVSENTYRQVPINSLKKAMGRVGKRLQ